MMIRQICRLSKVMLCNTFSINEILHTKDTKKKNRFIMMIAVWTLLAVMIMSYIVVLSQTLINMKMGNTIPMCLYMSVSMLILFFSFFKAGNIIFQKTSYEMMVSLPVSNAAIVISRFLTMYITNLLISFILIFPGMVVYSISTVPSFLFYIYALFGIIVLPLIPVTAATAIGAVITGISSRMRHKSLVSSVLSVMLVSVILFFNIKIPTQTNGMTQESFQDLAEASTKDIGHMYPLSLWYNNACVNTSLKDLLLLLTSSCVIFILMVVVVQKYFSTICNALNATSAQNNYKMQSLSTSSQLKSMWSREIKRYFSSSVYVVNTMVGYLLMVGLSVAVCVMGKDAINDQFGMPDMLDKAFPIVLAMVGNILPTTSSSISLEGKERWVIQTLPVKNDIIYKSKILVNLTISAPFYVVAVIAGIIGIRPTFTGAICIIIVPAVLSLFSSVTGLFINLKLPVFNWENETQAVKQSASGMLTMIANVVVCLIPAFIVIMLASSFAFPVMMAACIALLFLTYLFWKATLKIQMYRL
ncbi:MAG: hypothetical protein Q4F95_09395 [Oscillospiraceae bacterium]|nr:hypothetical protein [Oscillospiraceae bacterium]